MSGWGGISNPFAASTAARDADPEPPPSARTAAPSAWGNVPLDDEPAPANGRQTADAAWAKPKSGTKVAKSASSGFGNMFNSSSTPPTTDLAAKAKELEAREEAVRRREAELMGAAKNNKNWPIFLRVLRHDIKADVPVWNRSMVYWAYRVWLLSALCFMVNWLVILVMSFAGACPWTAFFVCTIATGIGLPLSFFLWYRRLYFSAQTDGAMCSYMMFLSFAFLHLAWCVWVILSIPGPLGRFCAGLFNYVFKLFGQDGNSFVWGIMCLVNVILWGLAALGMKVTIARGIMAMRAGDDPRKEYERRTGQAYVQAV